MINGLPMRVLFVFCMLDDKSLLHKMQDIDDK